MKLTKADYQQLMKARSPKSPLAQDTAWAFAVGGLICVVGQFILNFYQARGMSTEDAGGAASITLIFLGGLFTALHLYDRLAKHAGAGTLVPITGFANAIVSPAIEFRSEGLVLGLAAKMFAIAGPVLVYGISASIIYGLILWALGI